jgi:hypothetical protein
MVDYEDLYESFERKSRYQRKIRKMPRPIEDRAKGRKRNHRTKKKAKEIKLP